MKFTKLWIYKNFNMHEIDQMLVKMLFGRVTSERIHPFCETLILWIMLCSPRLAIDSCPSISFAFSSLNRSKSEFDCNLGSPVYLFASPGAVQLQFQMYPWRLNLCYCCVKALDITRIFQILYMNSVTNLPIFVSCWQSHFNHGLILSNTWYQMFPFFEIKNGAALEKVLLFQ